MEGDKAIRDKIAGREIAKDCLALGRENFPSASLDFQIGFWRFAKEQAEVALLALGDASEQPVKIVHSNEPVPMTAKEATAFEKTMVPVVFKKHAGKTIRQVMGSDYGYLEYITRANDIDDWKSDVRRYLAAQE